MGNRKGEKGKEKEEKGKKKNIFSSFKCQKT
jgi:hypothetical protein